MTNEEKEKIRKLLQENRGKFFTVKFEKKNGEIRKMNARQGVANGSTPLVGGQWANGAANPKDYDLILCTDIEKEKKKEHSRRSFKVSSVRELKIAGKTFFFGKEV